MKPGLYVATVRGIEGVRLYGPSGLTGLFLFDAHDGRGIEGVLPSEVTDLRPLVVLDPESDDPKRLRDAIITECGAYLPDSEDIKAALRALADPKPDEPTGLGAVVLLNNGSRASRYDTKGDPQSWWIDDQGPDVPVERRYAWSDLDVVEVLSEGWSE